MPVGRGIISTRQDVGTLFSRAIPLSAGQSVTSKPFEVSGFAQVIVSVFSDQPHQVFIEEATTPAGPWTPISTINSAPIGAVQRAAGRLRPVGCYMRATLQNLGSTMTSLSAAIFGTAT